jgi:hypothetical protein
MLNPIPDKVILNIALPGIPSTVLSLHPFQAATSLRPNQIGRNNSGLIMIPKIK